MRNTNVQYLNPAPKTISIRNDESSAVIYDGMVVVFQDNDNAEYPGVDVVTYATSAKRALVAGIARASKTGLVAGEVGEAVVFGFTYAMVSRSVRTSSTVATLASADSIAAGAVLLPSTQGGGYLMTGATTDPLVFIAAQSVGQLTTNPITGTDIPTANWSADNKAILTRMKVLVRSLQ